MTFFEKLSTDIDEVAAWICGLMMFALLLPVFLVLMLGWAAAKICTGCLDWVNEDVNHIHGGPYGA